jgi:NAD(P)-dependent dehydrogenase (short-subunit alcohol dehydrogenase family)
MPLRNPTRELRTALYLLQKSRYSTGVGLESSSHVSGLRGKTYLITGATSGIGLTSAELLAQQGATVLIAGRRENLVKRLIKNLRLHTGNQNIYGYCHDLSSMSATSALAAHVSQDVHRYFGGKLHCLINNAGVFLEEKKITPGEGLEMTWAVNTASPFLLTADLLPLITGKIINCSSISLADSIDLENTQETSKFKIEYKRGGHAAYGNSKLALNMTSYKLAEKLKATGSPVTVNCIDPGTVSTKLLHAGWGDVSYVALPAEEAHDVFWAATNSSLDGVSGSYYVNRKASKSPSVSYDTDMQRKVWDLLVAQTRATYDFDGKKLEEQGAEKKSSSSMKRGQVRSTREVQIEPIETAKASYSDINSSIKFQESVY